MINSSIQSRFLIAVVMLSVLQACGFKLRGSVELSEDMSPLYLNKNSVLQLGREIEALLKGNQIDLAADEKSSNAQLVLVKETQKRRVLSVDSDGRAREYLLSYAVTFAIKVNSSDVATAEQEATEKITLSRSLLFDPDAVLAVANESEILYKDMRRDAARLVLLKLQARSSK